MWKFYNFLINFRNQLLKTSSLMRRLPIQHLIEYNSHWPHITLSRICASIQYFWTHIHRTAYQRLMNLIQLCSFLIVLSKSKISNFISLIFDKNICRFKISMNNWMLMKIFIAADKLFDNNECFSLRQFLSFF